VRGLGVVALKCIGVLVMVGALRLVVSTVALSTGGAGRPPVAIALAEWAALLAQFLAGLWLVLRGGELARRWFDDEPLGVALGPRVVLHLALVILGAVFLALAVAGLCGAAAAGVHLIRRGGEGPLVTWEWSRTLVAAVYPLVQLVVGILLIVCAAPLSRRLWRERPPQFAELSPRAEAAPQLPRVPRDGASAAAGAPPPGEPVWRARHGGHSVVTTGRRRQDTRGHHAPSGRRPSEADRRQYGDWLEK